MSNASDIEELAANYALGLLSQTERADVEHRVQSDRGLSELIDAWIHRLAPIFDGAGEIEPPADLLARIETAIDRQAAAGAGSSVTVRAEEGRWIDIAPGARKKALYFDERARTEAFLLELDPGASLPAHDHNATEDCLVLAGEFLIGDLRLKAGDFHAAFAASKHAPCRSETGCRLFIKAAA